jgi:hypothetical protein
MMARDVKTATRRPPQTHAPPGRAEPNFLIKILYPRQFPGSQAGKAALPSIVPLLNFVAGSWQMQCRRLELAK